MFKTLERDALTQHPDFADSAPGKMLAQTPLGFIDIGARGGAHDMVEPLAKRTAVLGFEPDKPECERLLKNPEVTEPWAKFALEPVALADANGEATLYLLSAATNHSLLPPNDAFVKRYGMVKWEVMGKEPLMTTTLDDVLFAPTYAKEDWWGEFLKIDTQGTEYEILLGSKRTLAERTVAVVAEVSFCELYKGQKLFSEVEMFMRSQGFSFFGFAPIHGRSRKFLDKRGHVGVERALYSDAIFFRDPLPGGPAEFTLSPRRVAALFSIALLLNFYDYALELAKATWLNDAGEEERARIERLVADLSKLDPLESLRAVEQLSKQVAADPSLANLCVGNFVDRRRRVCDYDDVLGISPLPKTL